MHAEYRFIIDQLHRNPAVRAVVVTGTSSAFSVGGDSDALAGHAERGAYDNGIPADIARPGYGIRREFDHDFAFHFALRFPVIAAVNGACAGVALALVLFCDLRFAARPAHCTTAAPASTGPAAMAMTKRQVYDDLLSHDGVPRGCRRSTRAPSAEVLILASM